MVLIRFCSLFYMFGVVDVPGVCQHIMQRLFIVMCTGACGALAPCADAFLPVVTAFAVTRWLPDRWQYVPNCVAKGRVLSLQRARFMVRKVPYRNVERPPLSPNRRFGDIRTSILDYLRRMAIKVIALISPTRNFALSLQRQK